MFRVGAIISRRFSWRLIILATCFGFVTGVLVMGWRQYPWAIVPLVAASIVVLNPVMDQDLPTLIGLDMLKSPRTYIFVALHIAVVLIAEPYRKAFLSRFLEGR
jgi:hypothetical protein